MCSKYLVISSHFNHLPTNGSKTYRCPFEIKVFIQNKNHYPSSITLLSLWICPVCWLFTPISPTCLRLCALCRATSVCCGASGCRIRVRCPRFRPEPRPGPSPVSGRDQVQGRTRRVLLTAGCPPLLISKKSCLHFPFLPKGSASSCGCPFPPSECRPERQAG